MSLLKPNDIMKRYLVVKVLTKVTVTATWRQTSYTLAGGWRGEQSEYFLSQ